MVTHHFLQEKSAQTSLTLGVGKFDGVHLGHQKIIQVIRERASLTGSQPGVFTFRHFPVSFLLSSWNEKQSLLKKFGIKWCLWSDFEELSHWEPERFLERLRLWRVEELVVGFNFCFGAHRKGTLSFLKEVAPAYGFKVTVVEPVLVEGAGVNSTRIRKALETGQLREVNLCLGRPFSFHGRVITGHQRGNRLGFPTANLYPARRIPLHHGVYAVWVHFHGDFFQAAMNVGVSPTFGLNEETMEVHLLNFSGDLYGQELRVYLMKYLREEKVFATMEELRVQIEKDLEVVAAVLSEVPSFD